MEQSIEVDSELVGGRSERGRRWRTVEEKRRIVEETLAPGVSVAQVARLHGVNSNQVFQWRRQYQSGDLTLPSTAVPKLLPVMISDAAEEVPDEASPQGRAASIHIEFPGRALVSIEAGVDPALVAAVIERLMR
jgi:transposase